LPYIFNLGHGLLPETDPDKVEKLIKFYREYIKMKNDHPEVKFGKTGVLLINLRNTRLYKLVGYKKIFKRIFI
jgi:hypothetical protein